jgi:hypothetical protein
MGSSIKSPATEAKSAVRSVANKKALAYIVAKLRLTTPGPSWCYQAVGDVG